MRVLIDTCIFIFMVSDDSRISRDVASVIGDYDIEVCMSMESVRELIIAYRNKGVVARRWESADAMVRSITEEYFITILPVGLETLETYSRLRINNAEGHNDPSDHIIISQALTERLPLVSSDRKFKFYRRQGLDLIYNE